MDEREAERQLLSGTWAVPKRRLRPPSYRDRLMAGRKNWFVRMAMRGFVPSTHAKLGVVPLVQAALPELFEGLGEPTVSRYVREGRRRYDLLPPNGFDLERCQWLSVRLEGRRHRVQLLVNARSRKAAIALLNRELAGVEFDVR